MATLIDSSLWIDFTRAKSPEALKRFVAPFILDADAYLAEPIIFELLRFATDPETELLQAHFKTFPVLTTPPGLWRSGAELGRRCRKKGLVAGGLDLLIATVAIEHDAELVTFDEDFLKIAECSKLRVRWLVRPK